MGIKKTSALIFIRWDVWSSNQQVQRLLESILSQIYERATDGLFHFAVATTLAVVSAVADHPVLQPPCYNTSIVALRKLGLYFARDVTSG